MNREKLGLLNPKTLNFTPLGGIPELTPDDINYLLARISEPAGKYLRLIHSSTSKEIDKRWVLDVALALRREVAMFSGLEYWKIPRKEWILDMSAMALSETVSHEIGANICPKCDGRKDAVINNLKVVCIGCGGSGVKPATQEDRAEIMGVDLDFWTTWTQRYRRILNIIDNWNSEIGLADAIRRKKDE